MGVVKTNMLPVPILQGLAAAFAVYVIVCGFQLTDGVLTRPHRIFWRMIKGTSILYCCFLVFLCFQDINDIRWALGVVDNRIGKPLPEVNYADDCSLAALAKSIDIFVICHFLGWFVKALILRDFWLCWVLQIVFEWMEISLRHILPNFWECWWDHLLLDVFGCNAFGIWLGMKVVEKLNMKNYTWRVHSQSWKAIAAAAESPVRGPSSDPTKGPSALRLDENTHEKKDSNLFNRVKKSVYNFINPPPYKPPMDHQLIADHVEGASSAPEAASSLWWTTYSWPGLFSSFETFIVLTVLCITINIVDLNLFFIKAALWIPTNHWINGTRTIWMAIAAAATTRDVFEYASDRTRNRLGSQALMGFACVYMETALAFHLSSGLPESYPCPLYVKVAWVIIGILWICSAVFLFKTRRVKWFPPVEAAKAAGLNAEKAMKVVSKVGGENAVRVERLSGDETPVGNKKGAESESISFEVNSRGEPPNSISRKRK
eukprot:GDKK01018843.1.p1 GENE.GDKK01018843.1~~GDKK01018843.1.p1  ORF type:complete len:488 (+),score=130.58 GDKK01018843.1:1-1464(+)